MLWNREVSDCLVSMVSAFALAAGWFLSRWYEALHGEQHPFSAVARLDATEPNEEGHTDLH
jgi:hypothetical protein